MNSVCLVHALPETVFDPDSVSMSKDSVQEFQARSVISIVEMRYQEGGIWEMKVTHLKHAKKFMDSTRVGEMKMQAKVAGGKRKRKEKCAAQKEEVVDAPAYKTRGIW